MSEYIEQRESVLAEIENEYKNVDKIKTPFAKIIVDGTVEKPYYSILWLDKENKGYNVGYSSYCIDYVFKWLEECFEIVEDNKTNADRFRRMTNEEQQKFVRGFWEIEDFADWLQQPAKGE